MIVDSMSYEEIAHEIRKDIKGVYHELAKIATSKKYRKARLDSSNHGEMHFRAFTLTSSHNNKYVVYPSSPSRKHYLKNGYVFVSPFCFCKHRGHFLAVTQAETLSEAVADIQIYTEHFFQRYNERFLHDSSLSIEEVAEHFFRYEALQNSSRNVTDPKTGKVEKVCVFENGCSFVEIGGEYDYFIHRTFVNSNQLFANQNNDAFLMEAVQCLAQRNLKKGNLAYLLAYSTYKEKFAPQFEMYHFYHTQVKVNHEEHLNFQRSASELYDTLKDVWGITKNEALQRFGEHLQAIIHASGANEIEAIVKAEKNKQMA